MSKSIFYEKANSNPRIYAYLDTNPQYDGMLKVGFTTISADVRVKQQYPTLRPGKPPYKIVLDESAMRNDGSTLSDRDVHTMLEKMGFPKIEGEWFRCDKDTVSKAIMNVKNRELSFDSRTKNFKMRPEQAEAVNMTIDYYKSNITPKDKTPKFLWNAKMRFGKTFSTYQLAKKMNWKKVLVLTFKPAVESAWEEDLLTHVDFTGWQFYSRNGSLEFKDIDDNKPLICFGSFQDYLGKNQLGGIKAKNEWVHTTNWDCVVLDEYHYGAWRENAKDLFEDEDNKEQAYGMGEGIEYYDQEQMPITTDHYLYLSGTPFRAIATGEFIEDQIYNWTYSDEQQAKENWKGNDNPYASLPKMVLMTYQMPESITNIVNQGEFDEFDLNTFFEAKGEGVDARFIYENEVQKWLDLIRGQLLETTVDNLKQGAKKPPMPFSDKRLLENMSHTFWFLPRVASCHAMNNLLKEPQNKFFHEYKIVVAAGKRAGTGAKALDPVIKAMDEPLKTKTITLSCGKLTTGVTVKPWTAIFMLRNTTSPETYFQSAFRVQSPWVVKNSDGLSPNREDILKQVCYIFDFALNRALRQVQEYSFNLNVSNDSPEKKVGELINFLPVIAYDGSSMKAISASDVLDIAMSGTSATLLARRWESALLVNVDNETLSKLMANEKAIQALMNIEGFRSLNKDIEMIINKSESVKKAKKEANNEEVSKEKKKQISAEEKEYKNMRKKIQKKLIKFATRIPIFMYLTDYREYTLKDVITQLEPGLFKKVTGLDVSDFELLVSLNVFNSSQMNDAVYKFKRYEDASLSYTGIKKHDKEDIGLYDTSITEEEFYAMEDDE